jgi:translation elongation factor EF-G
MPRRGGGGRRDRHILCHGDFHHACHRTHPQHVRDRSRRGHMLIPDVGGDATIIRAAVPLANMFGYANTLRSLSRGRELHHAVRSLHTSPVSGRRSAVQARGRDARL